MEGIVGRAIVDEQYLGIVNALRYDALYACSTYFSAL